MRLPDHCSRSPRSAGVCKRATVHLKVSTLLPGLYKAVRHSKNQQLSKSCSKHPAGTTKSFSGKKLVNGLLNNSVSGISRISNSASLTDKTRPAGSVTAVYPPGD